MALSSTSHQQQPFISTYSQQPSSFQPTLSPYQSPTLPPLSPPSATDESDLDDPSGPRPGLQKGQTLMTSYMVPVKGSSSSSSSMRKSRPKRDSTSTSSVTSSCPPQSLTDASPLADPFVVTGPGLATNQSFQAIGNAKSPSGSFADLNGQAYGHGHPGGPYQLAYLTSSAGGNTTPQHQHLQPAGSLTSTVPLTPSTSSATPGSSAQPLLTTSQLPLSNPGFSTPGGPALAYQPLGYPSGAYPYPPHFSTPQAYASRPGSAAGPGNQTMPFSVPYPHTPTAYAYHLPPPPPGPSSSGGHYYYPQQPQSAPAKSAAYSSYAYPPAHAAAVGQETPVRPKKAQGSAKSAKAAEKKAAKMASPATIPEELAAEMQSASRRSSVEHTPPPIARAPLMPAGPSAAQPAASTSSMAAESSKKRASPVKEGSVDAGQKQAKRSRGLEIKTSSAEGRRLVFPETPSPEVTHAEPSKEAIPPHTPPRQIRSLLLSPRVVAVPGITETPNGTASFGMKPILESDLSWLEPVLKPTLMESPYYSASKRTDSIASLTRSERRRKRMDAFKVGADEADMEKKTTILKGYGRLATKRTTALSFLGETEKSVEGQEFTPNTTFTPVMTSARLFGHPTSGGLITPKSTPQSSRTSDESSATVLAVPDWPDSSYPWIDLVETRKKNNDKMAEVTKLEKLSRIERYLSHVSDDELDESDDAEEHVDLSQPADKTAEPSNAKEAIFNVTRNGLPAFSAGPSGRYLSGAMPTATGEDESGCLCGGLQQDAGSMVCCDNCSVWFHLSCCGIASEDDLGESWFCWRCEPTRSSAVRGTPISDPMSTPKMQQAGHPAFAATDETNRTYHAYTSDAALAPSPVFSSNGRLPDHEDTPGPYFQTPRIPSSGSTFTRFMTPGTPAMRMRNVSYAEHYNICQTPGAPQSDYKKVYSTPKFEDLLNDYTPMRATSPTPGGRSRVLSRSNPLFTTPSTSQSFLQGLQSATSSSATPGLVHSSSASAHYSPYPASPHSAPPKLHPAISDLSASPSPFRHRRQVSFNRVSFAATTSSNLRDSVVMEDMQALGKGRPLGLGGELSELSQKKET